MNVEQQIEKLQGLLERVKRNAALPHQPAAAPPAAVVAPAAPVPAVAAAPVPAAAAAPPPAVAAAPVPAVAAAPPPAVAAAPPPAVAAAEPVVEEPFEDVDLLEEEIVDLTAEEIGVEEIGEEAPAAEEPPAEEAAAQASMPMGPEVEEDIFFEDEEFEPPASSRRPKVAESMDEALAGAAEQDREVPLKTPPPESGRQVTGPPPQGLHQPAPPADLGGAVDDLLEADISSGTQHAKPEGPTPEQLGQTIDLEEAGGEPLELQAPLAPPPKPKRTGELEAPLPAGEAHGSYSADLAPPPEARAELEARRRREAEPPAMPSAPPPAPEGQVEPEVVQRPAISASSPAAAFVSAHSEFKPQSFVELLDASLSLGE